MLKQSQVFFRFKVSKILKIQLEKLCESRPLILTKGFSDLG
jgi:hypothetical protein